MRSTLPSGATIRGRSAIRFSGVETTDLSCTRTMESRSYAVEPSRCGVAYGLSGCSRLTGSTRLPCLSTGSQGASSFLAWTPAVGTALNAEAWQTMRSRTGGWRSLAPTRSQRRPTTGRAGRLSWCIAGQSLRQRHNRPSKMCAPISANPAFKGLENLVQAGRNGRANGFVYRNADNPQPSSAPSQQQFNATQVSPLASAIAPMALAKANPDTFANGPIRMNYSNKTGRVIS